MGDNRRLWIALISVDWGAVLNFGSSACPNECIHNTGRERICDQMGDAQPSAIAFYLQQQRSCCRVAYTKCYLMVRFEVFQRLIPLFPLREGGTSLYSHNLFNNTCVFCWEYGGVMCGKHWLANHLPVNNADKCTIDRGVPVNSHCNSLYCLTKSSVTVWKSSSIFTSLFNSFLKFLFHSDPVISHLSMTLPLLLIELKCFQIHFVSLFLGIIFT